MSRPASRQGLGNPIPMTAAGEMLRVPQGMILDAFGSYILRVLPIFVHSWASAGYGWRIAPGDNEPWPELSKWRATG